MAEWMLMFFLFLGVACFVVKTADYFVNDKKQMKDLPIDIKDGLKGMLYN